jgi:hypothetical protein
MVQVPSGARPPFSTLGISCARIGMKSPSGSMEINGSETTRAAAASGMLKPRWALRIMDADQYSRRNFPPPPR